MANDIYALEIIYTLAGEQAANVIHLQSSSSTPATDPGGEADQLIGAFIAACETDLQSLIANDGLIAGYTCRRINNGGGNTAVSVSGQPGTWSGASTAGQTCAVSVLGYSDGTHHRAGRIFWPVTGQGAILENVIDASIVNGIGTIIGTLMAGLSVAAKTMKLVVYSRKHAVAFQVVFETVSLLLGTIRKRLKPVM